MWRIVAIQWSFQVEILDYPTHYSQKVSRQKQTARHGFIDRESLSYRLFLCLADIVYENGCRLANNSRKISKNMHGAH
jgi:hypothetical protein